MPKKLDVIIEMFEHRLFSESKKNPKQPNSLTSSLSSWVSTQCYSFYGNATPTTHCTIPYHEGSRHGD